MSSERDPLLNQTQSDSRNDSEIGKKEYTFLEKILLLLSSSLFIVLCVLAGLYVQSVIERKVPPSKKPTPPPENKNKSICFTPECILTASQILQDVDFNLDPCDNFYQFTCSQWQHQNPVPHGQSVVNRFTILTDQNKETMRSILSGSFQDISAPSTGLPDPEQLLDEQNYDKLKSLYMSCLNDSLIDSRGAQPIYPLMRILRDHEPLDTLGYLAQRGVDALFRVQVDIDPRDPQRHIPRLVRPLLTLPTFSHYDRIDTIQTLYETIARMLDNIFQSSTEFDWTPYSANVTARMVVDFEKKLAKTIKNTHGAQEAHVMSLEQIKQKAPQVDWDTYFKIRSPNTVPLPDRLIIESPEYLSNLSDLISNEPVRSIQAYLMWRTSDTFAELLSEPIRQSKQQLDLHLNRKLHNTERPRWNVCVDYVNNSFGFLLGRYYILSKKDEKALKKNVEGITNSITKVFSHRLHQLEWLDEETRQKAKNKMGTLASKISYPETSPNVMSPISLSEYYGDLEISETDFFKNYLSCLQLRIRQEWNQIGHETDKKKWTIRPQEISSFYNPFFNEIVFPAGILQNPFFGKNYPDYLNYGGIGTIIGHELTHGFDRQGSLFDANGEQIPWWSNKTLSIFEKKSQCFLKQYKKFNKTRENQKTAPMGGKSMLAETLADNGGLKFSFMAWQQHYNQTKEQNHLLPGLDSLSPEQLFFVNYGRIWCDKSVSSQVKKDLVENDKPHLPAEWLVNGAIQNSGFFSDVFQCPKGSPMNPITKCELW